jgi:hypothetical protein
MAQTAVWRDPARVFLAAARSINGVDEAGAACHSIPRVLTVAGTRRQSKHWCIWNMRQPARSTVSATESQCLQMRSLETSGSVICAMKRLNAPWKSRISVQTGWQSA